MINKSVQLIGTYELAITKFIEYANGQHPIYTSKPRGPSSVVATPVHKIQYPSAVCYHFKICVTLYLTSYISKYNNIINTIYVK